MSQSFHLSLNRSRGLVAICVFLHGFGILASFWSLAPMVALVFSVLFSANLVWLWHRNLRTGAQAVDMLIFRDPGWLVRQDGKEMPIRVRGATVVWPWLVRLSFCNEETGRKDSLLIPRDAMSDTDYRHLCRCLRLVTEADVAPLT